MTSFGPYEDLCNSWPINAPVVKLARNEQCITLYPLTARYSIGPFPAQAMFRPSQGPLILGLICSIRLHTARYCHFMLVGQIQPVVTFGPFADR